jgi:hypothetical protein
MKSFDLESMGVHEMNALEMKETDGGLLALVAVAALLLLGAASCNIDIDIQVGGSDNTIKSNDSTMNGWSADSTRVDLSVKPL